MDPIIWAILLMVLAVSLVGLEIFVPSGGILGFLAVSAAVTSIFMAFFFKGPATGFAFIGLAIVGLPAALALAIKYWPSTSLGRRVLLDVPTGDEVLPPDDPRHQLQLLLGKTGRARSVMLPGGAVTIEGKTFEAVSEGMPIESGDPVRVVQVRHNRLVVRKAEEPSPPANPDDVLSQPIESLGIDSLNDPLA